MAATIVTWADKFGGRSLEAQALKNPSFAGERTPPADGVSLDASAVARVNGGRWIADCPAGCGGCEYVNFNDLRFFCCECRNAAWGNHPIPVVAPDADLRGEIEAVLKLRPIPRTRNWTGQTVDELVAENQEEGDPTP